MAMCTNICIYAAIYFILEIEAAGDKQRSESNTRENEMKKDFIVKIMESYRALDEIGDFDEIRESILEQETDAVSYYLNELGQFMEESEDSLDAPIMAAALRALSDLIIHRLPADAGEYAQHLCRTVHLGGYEKVTIDMETLMEQLDESGITYNRIDLNEIGNDFENEETED